MDLNDNIRHTDKEIPNLYIDNYKSKFLQDKEALEYDDDPVYTRMVNEGKLETINVYNNIGGLRPYLPEENYDTTNKRLNKEIAKHNIDQESKNKFYTKINKDNLHERDYLNLQNKADHIKKIDLALNFELKPTNYNEAFEFTDKKKYRTNHPDDEHHFKKSFIKTYTDFKIRQGHIMRK